jgi:hypothetical protein
MNITRSLLLAGLVAVGFGMSAPTFARQLLPGIAAVGDQALGQSRARPRPTGPGDEEPDSPRRVQPPVGGIYPSRPGIQMPNIEPQVDPSGSWDDDDDDSNGPSGGGQFPGGSQFPGGDVDNRDPLPDSDLLVNSAIDRFNERTRIWGAPITVVGQRIVDGRPQIIWRSHQVRLESTHNGTRAYHVEYGPEQTTFLENTPGFQELRSRGTTLVNYLRQARAYIEQEEARNPRPDLQRQVDSPELARVRAQYRNAWIEYQGIRERGARWLQQLDQVEER